MIDPSGFQAESLTASACAELKSREPALSFPLRRAVPCNPRVFGPHGKIKQKGRFVVALADHLNRILAEKKWRRPLFVIVQKDTLSVRAKTGRARLEMKLGFAADCFSRKNGAR
jgi:hypothetical protein